MNSWIETIKRYGRAAAQFTVGTSTGATSCVRADGEGELFEQVTLSGPHAFTSVLLETITREQDRQLARGAILGVNEEQIKAISTLSTPRKGRIYVSDSVYRAIEAEERLQWFAWERHKRSDYAKVRQLCGLPLGRPIKAAWWDCMYDSRLGQVNRPFENVFAKELTGWVNPRRMSREGTPQARYLFPHIDNNLYGIAMSGGGMRSATFSLGVLQALAAHDLVERADYMSTVSGGGYAGISLQSLSAARDLPYRGLIQLGAGREQFPYRSPQTAWAGLDNEQGRTHERRLPELYVHGNESPALWHVRKYSRLLGNSIGLFDRITWMTIGRNLLCTAILWCLFLLPMLLLPIALGIALWFKLGLNDGGHTWEYIQLIGPVIGLLMLSGIAGLLSKFIDLRSKWFRGIREMVPVIIAVAIFPSFVALVSVGIWGLQNIPGDEQGRRVVGGATAAGGGIVGLLGWLLPKIWDSDGVKKSVLKRAPNLIVPIGGFVLLYMIVVFLSLGAWLGVRDSGTWLDWTTIGWILAIWIGLQLPPKIGSRWLVRLLNELSPAKMYADRLQQTWMISARPDQGTLPANSLGIWSRVWPSRLRLMDLEASDNSGYSVPYPLFCCTLNTPGSRGETYAERNGDSFVLSPMYSGAATSRWYPTKDLKDIREWTLAEVASVSGAAVASNMGAKTSRSLSILVTLFNGRLGRWTENPLRSRRPVWKRWLLNRPAVYYLKELFGLASRYDSQLYVSDGGHFENLGVYELIRRRCRYILAISADAEPAGAPDRLSNLATAARLARVDFGVELVFDDLRPLLRDDESGSVLSWFCTGRIEYPFVPTGVREEDDKLRADNSGIIVVVKAAVVEQGLAVDVLNHWRSNTDFPYRGILDEQYDEIQFEAYRHLGFLAGDSVGKSSSASGQSTGVRFQALVDEYARIVGSLSPQAPGAQESRG